MLNIIRARQIVGDLEGALFVRADQVLGESQFSVLVTGSFPAVF